MSIAQPKRLRLPRGISYHSTSAGLRYRIRIRSTKILEDFGLDSPIDEVFDTLRQAEERLLKLKYKKDEIRSEIIKKAIAEISQITMKQLLEEVHKQYYSKTRTARDNKSRVNTISNTVITKEDPRIRQFLNYQFSVADLNKEEIKFGDTAAIDYEKHLQSFINARKLKVKNQTIVNDLMIISVSLKLGHKYFSSLPIIEHPLKNVNYKELKDQITYRDKRITPEQRVIIETVFIEHSRKQHYHNMFIFLAETGMRISEVLTVLVKDCNLEKRTIFITSKKTEKPRYVGITDKLIEVIKDQSRDKKLTDLLFTHSINTYQAKIKKIKERLAEKGIQFHYHMLRHTFISNAMNTKPLSQVMNSADISDIQHFQQQYLNPLLSEQTAMKIARAEHLTPQEIQTSVGHTNLSMTIGTYTHTQEPQQPDYQTLLEEHNQLKRMLIELLNKSK